jgi:hypothetical protein
MSLDKKQFSTYIKVFKFRELFNDMGWNNDKTTQLIIVDNETYTLQAVGEKSGFKILLCNPQPNGLLPDYYNRKKIETKVTKLFQEHLIIFFDTKKTEQVWQLVVRQSGKPTKVTETRWHINQAPELLYQRTAGIFFELDEEDKITIVDVKKRVGENFHQNNEKVTKQFYDKFKKEHSSFLQFIKGISDKSNQEWYASLMLNRLMFCYFIQKKGFLDNNKSYLRDKLNACTQRQAQGEQSKKFYSFYRDFLLVLFHKGLNDADQKGDIKKEIGTIPYLNGGLFDEHELEKSHKSIDIEDKAFERLFDFFDLYEWHLDTRTTATGKDINPDVIGYIFEKYINDRANMGAYYTKEDITDYISKNCILPFLFDETKRNYGKAFNPDGELWTMVKQSSDLYIYDAIKKGVELDLPKEIEEGIKKVSKRTEWNKTATINYALPTEIWREVVDRRNRYTEVKSKIENGEITSINDFITYNLNIRQFVQDAVENTNDPELLKHFYKALNSVTIIDPTCGSGAFLFAAMNILEPLYESCIQRMENFVTEAPKGKYKFFEETLAQVKSPQHPNLQYFIYKSIILRNLYGVDIMKEAVEIAKLRLFLKLVATVEADYHKPNLGLEPLPDIDFNIRAGNTLIGFATESELERAFVENMDFDNNSKKTKEKCEIVANAFKRYKEIQLSYGDDFNEFKKAKAELNKRLKDLNHELNQSLHKQSSGEKYEPWLKSHQPFHWFAEFYEIVQENGGFDVIIGNPPYSNVPKPIGRNYLNKFESALNKWSRDENLYTSILEQCLNIINTNGFIGMIVPLSITFSTKKPFVNLRRALQKKTSNWWWLHFDRIPSGLFGNEVRTRCTILIKSPEAQVNNNYTTSLKRWESDYREHLFCNLWFCKVNIDYTKNFPKVSSQIQADTLTLLLKKSKSLEIDLVNSISFSKLKAIAPNFPSNSIYIGGTAYNWFPAWREIPETFDENGNASLPARTAGFIFSKSSDADIVFALLCSSLGYWWWAVASDGFNLKKWLLDSFPLSLSNLSENSKKELSILGKALSFSLRKQFVFKENKGRIGNFFLPACAKEVEEIDNYLSTNVDGFSRDFFDDIRAFNSSFSRAVDKSIENDEESEDEE